MARQSFGGWQGARPPDGPFTLNDSSPQANGLKAWMPVLGSSQGANLFRDRLRGVAAQSLAGMTWGPNYRMGYVWKFDGTTSYFDMGGASGLNALMVGKQHSITFWYYATGGSSPEPFSQNSSGGSNLMLFFLGSGFVFSVSSTGATGTTASTIDGHNAWFHCVINRDDVGKTCQVYLNGTQALNFTYTVTLSSTDRLTFGAKGGATRANFMPGYMADVRVYDHLLSDPERRHLIDGLTMWDLYRPHVPQVWIYPAIGTGSSGIIVGTPPAEATASSVVGLPALVVTPGPATLVTTAPKPGAVKFSGYRYPTSTNGNYNSSVNVFADDNVYANLALPFNVDRNLRTLAFGWSNDIAQGSTLTGLRIEGGWYFDNNTSSVKTTLQAAISAVNVGTGLVDTSMPTTETLFSQDITGAVTLAQLFGSSFEVDLHSLRTDSANAVTIYVDYIRTWAEWIPPDVTTPAYAVTATAGPTVVITTPAILVNIPIGVRADTNGPATVVYGSLVVNEAATPDYARAETAGPTVLYGNAATIPTPDYARASTFGPSAVVYGSVVVRPAPALCVPRTPTGTALNSSLTLNLSASPRQTRLDTLLSKTILGSYTATPANAYSRASNFGPSASVYGSLHLTGVAYGVMGQGTVTSLYGSQTAGPKTEARKPLTASDDGRYYSDGSFNNTANLIVVGKAAGVRENGFIRFQNVQAPPGTLQTATLTVRAENTRAGTVVKLKLTAELALNPTAPTTNADAAGRARTTTSVIWQPANWTSGSDFTTPDLTPVLSEVMSQPGWQAGNAINLFVDEADGTSTNDVWFASWDHLTDPEPTLNLTYSQVSRAESVARSQLGSVVQASITVTAPPAYTVAATPAGVAVLGSLIFRGLPPRVMVTQGTGPTGVVLGPITRTGIIFLRISAIGAIVSYGSYTNPAPTPDYTRTSTTGPTGIVFGSVVVRPAPVSLRASSLLSKTILGSLTLNRGAISVRVSDTYGLITVGYRKGKATVAVSEPNTVALVVSEPNTVALRIEEPNTITVEMEKTMIDVSDVVRVTATFAVDGVNTDPTTVVFTLFAPDGTQTAYTFGVAPQITKTGVGVYRWQDAVAESGNYAFRWQGTGAVVAREEGTFFVNTPKF